DFDLADDAAVEFVELFRRHPEFRVLAAADRLDVELGEIIGIDLEAGHESGARGRHVPVPRDLDRVGFVGHRIKDRLVGQARGKGGPIRVFDQLQFLGADGAVEGGGFHDSGNSMNSGGTASVSQTPLSERKNGWPAAAMAAARTGRMTGLPRRWPTLVA